MKAFLILAIFTLPHLSIWSQSLDGQLLDATNGAGIPYAQIRCDQCAYGGTISNADGEFSLETKATKVSLEIFHIYYADLKVTVNTDKRVLVRLAPDPVELETAIISAGDMEKIIATVRRNMEDSQANWWAANGFYRQITKQDSNYTEILEALVELKVNSAGIQSYWVDQGRYAKAVQPNLNTQYIQFDDFSYLQRSLNWLDRKAPMNTVLNPAASKRYDLGFVRAVNTAEGNRTAVIIAEPTDKAPSAFGVTRLTVNLSDTMPLRLELLHPVQINFRKFSEPQIANLKTIIDFDQTATVPRVKSCRMLLRTAFTVGNVPYDITAENLLFLFDAEPTKARRSRRPRVYNDLKQIQQSGYDPQFWEDHPVVAKTRLEHDILRLLEGENYRGNYRF